jgi:hypothetical protein
MSRCGLRLLVLLTVAAIAAPQLALGAKETQTARGPRLQLKRLYKPSARRPGTAAIVHIGGTEYLTKDEYEQLKATTSQLLKKFPPQKHFFVGLGRDPTPFIAFLQELGGRELAVNFAGASGKNNWGTPSGTSASKWSLFKKYFAHYIPQSVWRGSRDIVLIDQTGSGAARAGTLAQFGPFVERYAKEVGFKGRIRRAAFSSETQPSGTAHIDTSKYEIVEDFAWGYEGAFSEYERDSIADNTSFERQTPKPEYTQYRNALRKRMQADAQLDRFLTKELGFGGRARVERPPPPPKPWPAALKMRFSPGAGKEGPLFSVKNPKYEKAAAKAKKKAAEGDGDGKAVTEPQTFDYLAPKEYAQLRDGVVKLLKKGNPKKSYFIGVGRSSTAYVAFMENLGTNLATYLPTDGLHKLADEEPEEDAKQTFFALFDQFIPAKAIGGARELVLFHQSETGASLPVVEGLLKEYLESKGSQAKVSVVALSEAKPKSGVAYLPIGKTGELQLLNTAKYHAVAPYGYYRPSGSGDEVLDRSGKAKARSKGYTQFKTALASRMKADETLAAAAKTLFAGE